MTPPLVGSQSRSSFEAKSGTSPAPRYLSGVDAVVTSGGRRPPYFLTSSGQEVEAMHVKKYLALMPGWWRCCSWGEVALPPHPSSNPRRPATCRARWERRTSCPRWRLRKPERCARSVISGPAKSMGSPWSIMRPPPVGSRSRNSVGLDHNEAGDSAMGAQVENLCHQVLCRVRPTHHPAS